MMLLPGLAVIWWLSGRSGRCLAVLLRRRVPDPMAWRGCFSGLEPAVPISISGGLDVFRFDYPGLVSYAQSSGQDWVGCAPTSLIRLSFHATLAKSIRLAGSRTVSARGHRFDRYDRHRRRVRSALGLSPQLYYEYYKQVIPDLPAQLVVGDHSGDGGARRRCPLRARWRTI